MPKKGETREQYANRMWTDHGVSVGKHGMHRPAAFDEVYGRKSWPGRLGPPGRTQGKGNGGG